MVPIFWGGVPYYYDCFDYNNCLNASGDQDAYAGYAPAEQAPAPQVIVIQQPTPVAEGPDGPEAEQSAPPATPSAAPAPVPAPDQTGFVLIRRNGQMLFASAYSVIGSNVRYITPEGIVHTLPLAELDMDSSRSMNEARGVELSPG